MMSGRAPEVYQGRIYPPGEGPNAPKPVVGPKIESPEQVLELDKPKKETVVDPQVQSFEILPDEEILEMAHVYANNHNDGPLADLIAASPSRSELIQALIQRGLKP